MHQLAAVELLNIKTEAAKLCVYSKIGHIGTYLSAFANACHEDVAANSENSKL